MDVTRQPIAVGAHSRRHLEERMGLWFPGALAFLTRLLLRLPPAPGCAK